MKRYYYIIALFVSFCFQPVLAKSYYVSTNGNDTSGTGQIDNPWRTITKAARIMQAGDTCYIREGLYRETVTPSNSGIKGNPIVYMAYPGESVEISGCEQVLSWTQHDGSIFMANINMNLGSGNQLLIRSELSLDQLWLARWPNSSDPFNRENGWALADAGSNATTLADSELPDFDWTGAEVRISQLAWGLYGQPVLSYSTNQIEMSYTSIWTNHDLRNGSKYFILNCYDALDADGEWFFDDASNVLYLVSLNGLPDPGTIEYKVRSNAFDLSGKSYIVINGIKLTASTIKTSGSSTYCTFDRLNVQYPYHSNKMNKQTAFNSGFDLNGSHHILKNSEVSWGAGTGVKLNGDYMELINSYIHTCNYSGSFSAGLVTISNYTRGHVISHNTLTHTGRSCIAWGNASDVLVQYNDMSHAGQLTTDLGMTYGGHVSGDGTVIRYNWVHDNDGAAKSKGVYFDHGSQNILIHNNVFGGRLPQSAIHLNQYGLGILCFNNTMANTSGNAFTSLWGNAWPDDMYGTQFINNVAVTGIETDSPDILFADNELYYPDLVDGKFLPSRSPAIDSGRILPGITDDFVGDGPDKGAYEVGGIQWTAGHDFNEEPIVDRTRTRTPFMNRISNAGFDLREIAPWMLSGPDAKLLTGRSTQNLPLSEFNVLGHASVAFGTGINRVSQDLSNLLPNTVYEFRGRMKAAKGESAVIGISDFGYPEIQCKPVSGNAPEWSDTRLRFRTGETDTSATIYAEKTTTGSGKIYVDDFSVFYKGEAEEYNVVIQVKDAVTGELIEQSEVNINNSGWQLIPGNSLQVNMFNYNLYEIQVKAEGYEPKTRQNIGIASDTTLVFALSIDYLDISLHVKDRSTGEAISRAKITYDDVITATLPDGTASLDQILPGSIILVLESSNYFTHTESFNFRSDTTIEILLTSKLADLTVSVTDSEGAIASTPIILDSYQVQTDGNGNAYFFNLQARNSYTVSIEKEGYNSIKDTFFLEIDTILQYEMDVETYAKNKYIHSVSLYPNPVSEILTIKGYDTNQMLVITDILGKELKTINMQSYSTEVDVSFLKPGIYLLMNKNRALKKFIKR